MPGNRWLINAEGGFLANTQLSRQIRHAAQPLMKFRQFLRTEPGLGKHRGDTINFNKIRNPVVQSCYFLMYPRLRAVPNLLTAPLGTWGSLGDFFSAGQHDPASLSFTLFGFGWCILNSYNVAALKDLG